MMMCTQGLELAQVKTMPTDPAYLSQIRRKSSIAEEIEEINRILVLRDKKNIVDCGRTPSFQSMNCFAESFHRIDCNSPSTTVLALSHPPPGPVEGRPRNLNARSQSSSNIISLQRRPNVKPESPITSGIKRIRKTSSPSYESCAGAKFHSSSASECKDPTNYSQSGVEATSSGTAVESICKLNVYSQSSPNVMGLSRRSCIKPKSLEATHSQNSNLETISTQAAGSNQKSNTKNCSCLLQGGESACNVSTSSKCSSDQSNSSEPIDFPCESERARASKNPLAKIRENRSAPAISLSERPTAQCSVAAWEPSSGPRPYTGQHSSHLSRLHDLAALLAQRRGNLPGAASVRKKPCYSPASTCAAKIVARAAVSGTRASQHARDRDAAVRLSRARRGSDSRFESLLGEIARLEAQAGQGERVGRSADQPDTNSAAVPRSDAGGELQIQPAGAGARPRRSESDISRRSHIPAQGCAAAAGRSAQARSCGRLPFCTEEEPVCPPQLLRAVGQRRCSASFSVGPRGDRPLLGPTGSSLRRAQELGALLAQRRGSLPGKAALRRASSPAGSGGIHALGRTGHRFFRGGEDDACPPGSCASSPDVNSLLQEIAQAEERAGAGNSSGGGAARMQQDRRSPPAAESESLTGDGDREDSGRSDPGCGPSTCVDLEAEGCGDGGSERRRQLLRVNFSSSTRSALACEEEADSGLAEGGAAAGRTVLRQVQVPWVGPWVDLLPKGGRKERDGGSRGCLAAVIRAVFRRILGRPAAGSAE